MHLKFNKKAAISFSILFIFGAVFGYAIFPNVMKMMIRKSLALQPGSAIRGLYQKVPFPIDFRMYVFNVTNKEEIMAGGKPRVQEIGPYYFEEWKEKFNMEDDETDDTVSFNYKNTFIFRPDLSNGLTGNEIITTPHLFIWSMALAANIDKKPMLPTIAIAIDELLNKPEDSFWTGRAMDLFFDGIKIDCSSTHFAAQGICIMFEVGEVKIVRENAVTYRFSIFGAVNGTDLGRFKVHRGIKNIMDLGRVVSFNGAPEMDVWDDDKCNQYKGTDSTIFPPFLEKEDGLWAYEPSMCRALGAVYEKPSSYEGIPSWRYTIGFGDARTDEKLHCYCMDPPHDCPRKGTYDLIKCAGAPMVASMPHFYDADPAMLEKIASGLNPNKKDHAIYLDFVALTGSPISAAKRLQFNMDVKPVEGIKGMEKLQEMVFPLFWVEESASINKTYVDQMKLIFTMFTVNSAIKWICMVVGGLGFATSIYLYFKEQGVKIGGSSKTVNLEGWMRNNEKKDSVSEDAMPSSRT